MKASTDLRSTENEVLAGLACAPYMATHTAVRRWLVPPSSEQCGLNETASARALAV